MYAEVPEAGETLPSVGALEPGTPAPIELHPAIPKAAVSPMAESPFAIRSGFFMCSILSWSGTVWLN